MGVPNVLVCSVGTEIFFDVAAAEPVPDSKWSAELDQGWNRQQILKSVSEHAGLKLQVCCTLLRIMNPHF